MPANYNAVFYGGPRDGGEITVVEPLAEYIFFNKPYDVRVTPIIDPGDARDDSAAYLRGEIMTDWVIYNFVGYGASDSHRFEGGGTHA